MMMSLQNIWNFPLSAVIYCLITIVLLVGCNENKVSAEKEAARVKEVVSLGMNVDTAILDLRKEGFKVGEKIKPTKKADYYQVNVVLCDKIPVSESVKYVIGVSSKKRSYVVIKASLDGEIVSID